MQSILISGIQGIVNCINTANLLGLEYSNNSLKPHYYNKGRKITLTAAQQKRDKIKRKNKKR